MEWYTKHKLTFPVRDISYGTSTVDVETYETKSRMNFNPRDNPRIKVHDNFKKKL